MCVNVEIKITASSVCLHWWGRRHRFLFFIQKGLPGLTQPYMQSDKHTQTHKCGEKKERDGGEKTWIPPTVCVLEQVNSLYSRIAITSTLQQGCSWLELNAQPNKRLIFFFSSLPIFFFVKMQIWPASH